jgi:pyrimidine-nucleoside phosphorylase
VIPQRLIEAKRNGEELASSDLDAFLTGFLAGAVPDYQMAAFLMAVYFRGLSSVELTTLLDAMLASGSRLDIGHLGPHRIDKHSTGGVGDKVSLVLAPLVAELGIIVPMMSGRALGHTGGTLDKLEAIPGFRTRLSEPELTRVVEEVGCVMIGQTEEIAPLDRRLYALRDVTATVPCVPLIAASIMSKKLAEDLTGLVLDVKVGRGAFLTSEQEATELARTMVRLGTEHGVETVACITGMDQPLGSAIGNGLETREAIQALRGGGPTDLRHLVLALASEMLVMAGAADSREKAELTAGRALDDGSALGRFRLLVERQGGNPSVVDDPDLLASAPERGRVEPSRTGFVHAIDPLALGWGVVELGGGRRVKDDRIDPAVGFELSVKVGDRVNAGDALGVVHARTPEDLERGVTLLRSAVQIEEAPAKTSPLLHGRLALDER